MSHNQHFKIKESTGRGERTLYAADSLEDIAEFVDAKVTTEEEHDGNS